MGRMQSGRLEGTTSNDPSRPAVTITQHKFWSIPRNIVRRFGEFDQETAPEVEIDIGEGVFITTGDNDRTDENGWINREPTSSERECLDMLNLHCAEQFKMKKTHTMSYYVNKRIRSKSRTVDTVHN